MKSRKRKLSLYLPYNLWRKLSIMKVNEEIKSINDVAVKLLKDFALNKDEYHFRK